MFLPRIALFMGLVISGVAQAAGGVSLTTELYQEVTVTNAQGVVEKQMKPAAMITPGLPLAVVISYENKGTQAAEKVEIKNPLAPQLAFTGEASGAGAAVDYSVDGGKSYAGLAALKVPAADGKLRAALVSDVNAIRFKLIKPVQPGESGKVEFRASVR